MASNNRKPSQRWLSKSADDRARHTSRAQQSGGSLHGKRKVDSKKVQETLDDMFKNVFDAEIIRSVAHSCGWDLSKSIETLIMLSEGEDSADVKLQRISAKEALSFAISKNQTKEKSPELSKQNVPANTSKTKSVMMNTSQGPIKVMYKGHDDPDISDDDADVVIEEENEIEDNSVDLTFASVASQSMCQFLTHLIPSQEVDCYSEFKRHNTDNTSVILNSKSKEGLLIDQSEMPAKKTKHWHQFERIKKQINESIKVMVLLRGVPGSGKTSLARHIIKVTHGENYEKYVFSTDHYFVLIGKGKYVFDHKLLPEAHKWNQHRVYMEAKNGTNPILIDNTNIESWEMKPYVEIAVDYGYNIELLEPKTSWRYNPLELEKKNIHNVPRRKIEDMLIRFERDLTPGKLMTYFNLKYKANNSPPQFTPQFKNISLIQKEIALSNLRKKSKLKKGDDQKCGSSFKNKLLYEKLESRNVSLTDDTDANEGKISSWTEVSPLNNAISDSEEAKFKETTTNNSEFKFLSNEFSSFQAHASVDNSADPSFEFSDVQNINVNKDVSASGEDNTENGESNNDWEDGSNSINRLSLSNVSENDVLGAKPLEKNVECTNYVLVMKDGTLLPQKSYTEEFDLPNFSQVCGRKWEYILMADNSRLLLNSGKFSHDNTLNSDLQNTSRESQLISVEKPFVQSHSFEELPGHSADVSSGKTFFHQDPVGDSFNDTDQQQFQLLDLSDNPVNIAFTGVDESASSSELQSLANNSETDMSSSTDKLGKLSETTFNTLISPSKNQMTCDVMNMNPQDHFIDFIEAFSFQSSENITSVQSIALECDKYRNEHDNIDSVSPCDKSENSEQAKELARSVKLIDINCDVKEPINHNFDHISLHTTHGHESLDKIHNDPDLFEQEVKVQSENIKDILTLWNEGNSWDDQEHNSSETIKPSAFSPTPKPARLNNRRLVSCTDSEKIIDEQSIDKALESTSSGIWSVVDEPLESWEAIMNEKKVTLNDNIITEARPQREQFATGHQPEAPARTELEFPEDNSSITYDTSVSKYLNNDAPSDVADISNNDDFYKVKTDFLKMGNAVDVDAVMSYENVASTSSLDKFDGISEITKTLKDGVHISTNTCHLDFMVLNSVNTGTKITDEGYRVLVTSPRNIIETEQLSYIPSPRKIFPVLLLDKSSMTSDECYVTEMENFEEQLRELVHMFPSCTADDLQEIFEKCNKDINWTVDLLLESACQGVIISALSTSHRSEIENGTQVNADSATASNSSIKCVENEPNSVLVTRDPIPHIVLTPDIKCLSEQNMKTLSSNKRNGKKDRNAPLSEESLLIKKQLEENIVINEEHYSEHVSRIRKLRHGEIADMTEVPLSIEDLSDSRFTEDTEEMANSIAAGVTRDSIQVLCPDAVEWEGAGISQDIPEEEECVSLQLDPEFADQLHSLFGTATLPFSQAGMKPCLNLPLSLARQLHYYMLEAEQNSYDLMMQEDEELARKLQLQEELGSEVPLSSSNQVPDLREIMDMEMALALYKADQKQNSPDGKDDLATKLTKDLLCEWFPSLPRDILVNVFEAHHGSFEETIEVLIASTEEDNCVRTVMTPEARVAHERALLQKASLEYEKSKENLVQQPVNSEKTTQEKALEDAYYYRSEASRHYKLRNECQQKAQKTFQRGLTAVAAYYSQMASLHKERIEENNAKAASSLLLAHSLGNLTTTLDLHFLYVVEALQVLDMFLDHHVNQLLESGHRLEHLFVITGRGARSSGGRSRIKPAVIQRLEQRGLRHVEVNPGLLKVTITRNATSSTRIAS